MIWFFVVPALGFTIWASVRLVDSLIDRREPTLENRIAAIETARSSGDRWQAAFELAQDLLRLRAKGTYDSLPEESKVSLFQALERLVSNSQTDARVRHYVYLTLGQLKDPRGLSALESGLNATDSELRFYAAWGFLEILQLDPAKLLTAPRLVQIRSWLRAEDSSLARMASSFLAARQDPADLNAIAELLTSQNVEIRWNAAVALASVQDSRSEKILMELFDLSALRSLGIRSRQDLEQLVAAAASAASKLGSPEVLEQARKLKAQVSAETPEGRAILSGLRTL
jgi:HEAT repeat protein